MSFLNGTDPSLRQTRTPTTQEFTGSGQGSVTLSADPGSEDNVIITFDGVVQHRSTYSVSGTTVSFSSAVPTGVAKIEATFTTTHPVTEPADNSVTLAKLADGTQGQILYYGASGAPTLLNHGTSGHFLKTLGSGANPAWAAAGGGKIIQVVNTQTGAHASGTTVTYNDDTIPQKTEGNEWMTLAVTPTSASNKLIIDVVCCCDASSDDHQVVLGLFQDTTANALAAVHEEMGSGAQLNPVVLRHYMAAGTTSSTTFKVRGGTTNSGTMNFNGSGGSRMLGGALASSITIWEIEV